MRDLDLRWSSGFCDWVAQSTENGSVGVKRDGRGKRNEEEETTCKFRMSGPFLCASSNPMRSIFQQCRDLIMDGCCFNSLYVSYATLIFDF